MQEASVSISYLGPWIIAKEERFSLALFNDYLICANNVFRLNLCIYIATFYLKLWLTLVIRLELWHMAEV